MDDFGNALHWTETVKGWHSLGAFGWATGWGGLDTLFQSVQNI